MILSVHYLLTLLAFDVVDHSILIRKLSMYKFEEQSLLWFISYLKSRQQVVIRDQGLSDFTQVEFGHFDKTCYLLLGTRQRLKT